MSTILLSTSAISRTIRILNPVNGDVQEIQVQRGKYELPEGYQIAQADLALYQNFLSVIDGEGKVLPLSGVQSIVSTPIARPVSAAPVDNDAADDDN